MTYHHRRLSQPSSEHFHPWPPQQQRMRQRHLQQPQQPLRHNAAAAAIQHDQPSLDNLSLQPFASTSSLAAAEGPSSGNATSVTTAAAAASSSANATTGPPRHTRPLRKTASIGSSRILECDVRYPGGVFVPHIVTWRKLGVESPIFILFDGYPPRLDSTYYGRIRPVGHASIELSNITTADQGWYECSVLFLDRSDDVSVNGTWIHLTVNVPPLLTNVSPELLVYNEGDNVDLRCEATATPSPSVTWYKDNRELTSSDHVTLGTYRIQLRALRRSDAGVYTCTFKNGVGSISHVMRLVVHGNGWVSSGNIYITVPPRNATLVEGSRLRLTCQAEGYPDNITYRWYRDDVDVQLIPGLMQVRGQVLADGTLSISNIVKDDTGWYKCRAMNLVGVSPEASAYLNVTYLPRVQSMPERLYLPRGLMGRIDCPVESNPPLTVIVWSKSGRPIDFEHVRHAKVNKQGTLIFSQVQTSDDGQYTCTPYSPLGAGHQSAPVRLFVRDPPQFSVRPKPYYQSQQAQSVTIPCVAEGDPRPSVRWRKAEGTFPNASRALLSAGNLTLIRLVREDQGVYECIAASVVSSVITTTLLIIEGIMPHPPLNVSVNTSRSVARLSWMPAYDGGLPLHYVIWYRVTNTRTDWKTWRVAPAASDVLSLTLHQLRPNTEYEFSVMARSTDGSEYFSSTVTASTKSAGGTSPIDIQRQKSSSDAPEQRSVPHLMNTPPYATDRHRLPPNYDMVSDADRPPQPFNLTVGLHKSYLQIAWSVSTSPKTRPADYHMIHYRTVGQWVPLYRAPAGQTVYNWTTASRGAVYHFRVNAYYEPTDGGSNSDRQTSLVDDVGGSGGSDDESLESLPSATVTVNTGDPLTEPRNVSNNVVGGIGLTTAVVTGTIAALLLSIHCYRKWRSAKKAQQAGQIVPTCDLDQDAQYDNHIPVPSTTIVDNGGLTVPIATTSTLSGSTSPAVKETPI